MWHGGNSIFIGSRISILIKALNISSALILMQLLDLIISELKSHVIPYKFKSSHWLKLLHSDWRANLVKDFFFYK